VPISHSISADANGGLREKRLHGAVEVRFAKTFPIGLHREQRRRIIGGVRLVGKAPAFAGEPFQERQKHRFRILPFDPSDDAGRFPRRREHAVSPTQLNRIVPAGIIRLLTGQDATVVVGRFAALGLRGFEVEL
jgi:hypothetical protein